jgi:ERCC4-type nuclease
MARAPKAQPVKPTIVVDTREQRPFAFSDAVTVVRGTLHTGDYSLLGHESAVCLERKALDDLVGSVIQDRERFERELARMREFAFKCVLIEGSLADVRDHRYVSRAHPSAVFGSVMCLHVDHGVPFLWCHDRAIAARVAERLLRRFYENQEKPLDTTIPGLPQTA